MENLPDPDDQPELSASSPAGAVPRRAGAGLPANRWVHELVSLACHEHTIQSTKVLAIGAQVNSEALAEISQGGMLMTDPLTNAARLVSG